MAILDEKVREGMLQSIRRRTQSNPHNRKEFTSLPLIGSNICRSAILIMLVASTSLWFNHRSVADDLSARSEQQQVGELQGLAMRGNAGAQYALGKRYLKKAAYIDAAKWFREAAEQGYGRAQGELGKLYQEGKGVTQDYAEAYFWLLLAPKHQGDALLHYDSTDAEKHLTSEQKAAINERVKQWEKAHPSPTPTRIPTPINQ